MPREPQRLLPWLGLGSSLSVLGYVQVDPAEYDASYTAQTLDSHQIDQTLPLDQAASVQSNESALNSLFLGGGAQSHGHDLASYPSFMKRNIGRQNVSPTLHDHTQYPPSYPFVG